MVKQQQCQQYRVSRGEMRLHCFRLTTDKSDLHLIRVTLSTATPKPDVFQLSTLPTNSVFYPSTHKWAITWLALRTDRLRRAAREQVSVSITAGRLRMFLSYSWGWSPWSKVSRGALPTRRAPCCSSSYRPLHLCTSPTPHTMCPGQVPTNNNSYNNKNNYKAFQLIVGQVPMAEGPLLLRSPIYHKGLLCGNTPSFSGVIQVVNRLRAKLESPCP